MENYSGTSIIGFLALPMCERLQSAREGNPADLEWARQRYIHCARRWFLARLPKYLLRGLDVDRCVTETFTGALLTLDPLETREGAFQLILRSHLQTRISSIQRETTTHDTVTNEDLQSPIVGAVGMKASQNYECALENLSGPAKQAVIARIEFGFDYRDLAEVLGEPTAETARTAVVEAVNKLAEAMCDEG